MGRFLVRPESNGIKTMVQVSMVRPTAGYFRCGAAAARSEAEARRRRVWRQGGHDAQGACERRPFDCKSLIFNRYSEGEQCSSKDRGSSAPRPRTRRGRAQKLVVGS